MLDSWKTSCFYVNSALKVPRVWNLSRKHVRVQTSDGRFVKLNKFENRVNAKELRGHCVRLSPVHVYMSVLDWLFPERVGKKYKGNYAVPFGNGEFVVDIDSYLTHRWHNHNYSRVWKVCKQCLEVSKEMTMQACRELEWYYSDVHVVFSGRNGFHIHVLDFDITDWTKINYRDLVKTHEVARFRFSKVISLQTYCFDRAHFILSVDPMRIITVPNTLNAETGLVCSYIGGSKDLELQTVENIVVNSQPVKELYGYPEPNRAVKKVHKTGGGNMARVTAMTPPPLEHFFLNH